MMLLKLGWKNIWHKPLTAGMSILLLALGTGLMAFLGNVGQRLEDQFRKNLENVHMVVGAKGSPIQIILSSIYHVSPPTGNISYQEAKKLAKNPLVEWSIPMSLGDSYRGIRIVGTTHSYINLFHGEVAEGKLNEKPQEVVVGDLVAKRLNLALGSTFSGNHGLQETEHKHDEHPYKVVGILKPSGTVLDQLIICDLQTVWLAHHGHGKEGEQEITNMLFKFRNAMGQMTLGRMVNEQTNMQAALPSIEVNMLLSNLGVGLKTLWLIGLIVILVSGLSVFVSLYNAIKERKYELALLRSLGASKWQLLFVSIFEGLMLAAIGGILGLVLTKVGSFWAYHAIGDEFGYQIGMNAVTVNDLLVFAIALGIGLLASVIPGIHAMQLNISRTLAND